MTLIFTLLYNACNIPFLEAGKIGSGSVTHHKLRIAKNQSSNPAPPQPGSLWTWAACATLELGRLNPVVVPYDGKISICGGVYASESWVQIYDPQKDEFERRNVPEDICMENSSSCYMWDSTTASTKARADGSKH
ncbi:hypothetical protein CRG98_013608 [Punica granatum]|uniref:Uncharacterized protein n=1 Tax=Punica granatum TaxID=22663 RepID=A0A2I0KD19_PUNGR|nr:hypothetical protein CRG98_013608 [Punica granatum]